MSLIVLPAIKHAMRCIQTVVPFASLASTDKRLFMAATRAQIIFNVIRFIVVAVPVTIVNADTSEQLREDGR
jgi:hypothetical protein